MRMSKLPAKNTRGKMTATTRSSRLPLRADFPYETQNPVSCSAVTEAGDNWEIITSWNSGGSLTSLQFDLNGNEFYSLSESQICTGYSGCSITNGDAYFQSVFVGADGTYLSVTFTSLAGQMTYTGYSSLGTYSYCTGEYSNAAYASIHSGTQVFGFSGNAEQDCS